MKPFSALVAALLLLASLAAAETHVPAGPVSGTWTNSGSPYYIEGNINIPAGATLTMLPGTVVIFSALYDLTINGTLHISGAMNDSVKIQGVLQPGIGIVDFTFANPGQTASVLEYGSLNTVQLNLGAAPITIDRCRLTVNCYIGAQGSSGNILTNSTVSCETVNGTNWTMANNNFYRSITSSTSPFGVQCIPVISAQGYFGHNTIFMYANYGGEMGQAIAVGFRSCSGTFEYNTINAHSWSLTGYGEESYGFETCAGICRYNSIDAGDLGINGFTGEVRNCTVINTDVGIGYVTPGPVKNCIVYGCQTGYAGTFALQYSDAFACQTPYSSNVTLGPGNLQSDPLLVNNYFLSAASPCIDAGDPTSPLDPDSTRADMGANYFNQSSFNLVTTLSPVNPPILIPAQGGSFQFTATAVNNGPTQIPFYIWARIEYPDGTYTWPVLGPVQVNPPVGQTLSRLRQQDIPGSWPAGTYKYLGYADLIFGYPVEDSSWFTFTKSAAADGGPWIAEAKCYGEPFPGERSQTALIPSGLDLGVCPNPFNPTTAISYQLQAASQVSLRVYDTAGRLVGTLIDGMQEAGQHNVTFDGSELASGIYWYTLQTGTQTASGKMLLVK